MWLAVWLICVVITGLTEICVWLRLQEEIDADVSEGPPPASTLFCLKSFPWVTLREHRERFPNATRIRLWAILAFRTQITVMLLSFLMLKFV